MLKNCFFVGAFLFSQFVYATEPWADLARHLSGESEVSRLRVIAQLRSIHDLKPQLRAGLATSARALALDVIAALQLGDFLPELLEQMSQDQDGSIALTTNALLTKGNSALVLKKYSEALANSNTLPPSLIVAMLDPLGRLSMPLSHDILERLLNHPFYEVRSAALYYVRLMTLRARHPEYFYLITQALKAKPYQLRLQAISLAGELKAQLPLNRLLLVCLKDTNTAVRVSCEALQKREVAK